MARFLTAPRRQMVNPYPEVNVDFYSNLMGQAQQNLNQATQMQSQALDYIYNLPVYSEEDRASVITPAEEKFQSMLDSEFISPSQVAGTIMDVRREIQPGVQALQAKSKAADMYDKLKVQYGVNALMGTDPRSLSIKTQEGNWRDPSQFKASGVNMEDIDKLFLQSQTSNLNKPGGISYIKGQGIDVNGVPEGMIETRQYKGLSEQERNKLYHPSSSHARQLAESQLQSMPELLDVVGGDKEKALQAIINRNWSTSGSYKQDINYGSTGDPSYTKPEENTIPQFTPIPGRQRDIAEAGEQVANNTKEELNSLVETAYSDNAVSQNMEETAIASSNAARSVSFYGAGLYGGGPINPGVSSRANKKLKKLIEDPAYEEIYKEVKSDLDSDEQFMKDLEDNKGDSNYKDKRYAQEFVERIAPIESALRILKVEEAVFTPKELTKLYSDAFTPNRDKETMSFKEITEDGELSSNYANKKEFFDNKGQLKPEFQEVSFIVNPFEGRIELASTDSQKRYALEIDKLDKNVQLLFNTLSSVNDLYIESMKKGKGVPNEEVVKTSKYLTDMLYKALYTTYSEDNSKENQLRNQEVSSYLLKLKNQLAEARKEQ